MAELTTRARPRVAVFDYGSGNLRSAERALAAAGAEAHVVADAKSALAADGLVVPGVGAFATCIAGVRERGVDAVIRKRLAGGGAVLGICVGAQILFDSGSEHGRRSTGLGLLPGAVERIRAERVPHMGWNTVRFPPDAALFAGIDPADRFYFVHSYAALPDALPPDRVAVTEHDQPFAAAAWDGPLSAVQFHPEKSGQVGARLLSNWIRSLK